jgi:hypothetical protein
MRPAQPNDATRVAGRADKDKALRARYGIAE